MTGDRPADRAKAHGSGSFYGWLCVVVFPWVEPKLPFNQVTVGR